MSSTRFSCNVLIADSKHFRLVYVSNLQMQSNLGLSPNPEVQKKTKKVPKYPESIHNVTLVLTGFPENFTDTSLLMTLGV